MMRRLLLSLLTVAALFLASCASPLRSASVHLVVEAPQSLPARFVNRLVLVDVSVDGRAPAPFLLDTGSDVTVIDRRLLNELKLPVITNALARGAGGTVNTTFVRGKSIDLGPLHIENPAFLALDLGAFDDITNSRIHGIIGLDSLEDLALRIDYPAKRVEIGRSGMFTSAHARVLPLRRRENLCGVDIQIGDAAPVPVLLDTGMSGSLSLEFTEAARRGVSADPMRRNEWRVGVGGGSSSQVANVPWVGVADRSIPRVEMVLAKPAGMFAGAIGGGLLRFFQVTIDFGSSTVLFCDSPSPAVELARGNTTGVRIDFRYDWMREGVRVECVRSDTPAARAGLRAGDMITAIDGEPLRSMGWRRMREMFAIAQGESTWTVATRSGGAARKLDFTETPAPAQGSPR